MLRTRILSLIVLSCAVVACGSTEERGMTRAEKRAAQEARAANANAYEADLDDQMAVEEEDPGEG